MNNNLILISGKTATGKSLSLRGLKDPDGVIYLNCENNKALPFKHGFRDQLIIDPKTIPSIFAMAEDHTNIHTIVIDSLDYMMDMYESRHVIGSANTMQAWGDYAQFFKNLMAVSVANSTKNVIFIAHTLDIYNEGEMATDTLVKVKGSLMNQGIESYFSTVVSTKRMPLTKLEKYGSPLLTFNEDEKILDYKYCFQVKLTKETVNERIRHSLDMWSTAETYIDNDVQILLDRIHDYYK